MEKAIYIVEVLHLSDDFFLYNNEKKEFLMEHLYDDILCIKDKFYTIYFIYDKKKDFIYIYLVKYFNSNNTLDIKGIKDIKNYENNNIDYKDYGVIKYQILKKDFKNFVINNNLSSFENELPEFIFNHLLNYDYNLWNDINDWLNSNLNYKNKQYHLIFIKINTIFPFNKNK